MSFRSRQSFRVATLLVLATALVAAAASERAKVEAKLAREGNPIKKALLEVQLAEISLKDARRLYQEGDPENGLEKLKEMLSWSEKAHDRLFQTGRNPRKKPGGFKKAEIRLRKLGRRLADLLLAVPFEERKEIQNIAGRLSEIRERLLLGILQGKEAKK